MPSDMPVVEIPPNPVAECWLISKVLTQADSPLAIFFRDDLLEEEHP